MKRLFSTIAVIAAMALTSQSADAAGRGAPAKMDPQLVTVGIATGVAATVGFFALNNWTWNSNWNAATSTPGLTVGGAYALTSVGCAVAAPMIGTVVVKRPLTAREANLLITGCFIPIVGPLVLNAVYDANPQWFAPPAPVRGARRARR